MIFHVATGAAVGGVETWPLALRHRNCKEGEIGVTTHFWCRDRGELKWCRDTVLMLRHGLASWGVATRNWCRDMVQGEVGRDQDLVS